MGSWWREVPGNDSDPAELAASREALATIAEICERVARGDLEARVPPLEGSPDVLRARLAINRLVDVTDAFVREAGASLTSASERRFHRRFLLRGMPGTFRDDAATINRARDAMHASVRQVAHAEATRAQLVETVREVSEQVAAAAVELGASASGLASDAGAAVGEASAALGTVHALEQASQEIQYAVTLIKQVAGQTRLLALNATIEAARAGDSGRGFAVVAGEVKSLADETQGFSDDITRQVEAAQQAAQLAVGAIERIAEVMRAIDDQVAGVAAAANGSEVDGGLAQLAETLHAEVARLAGTDSGP